ncbi:MAG: hypothetical protein FJ405_02875 [Verrucomicrobia bacterium]|nr:hypothetical protein [Verrucomicrobiota bacterium]
MKKNSTEPPPHRQDDGEAHRPPPHVRGYDLLRCVGRGSYGEVWLGRALEGGFLAIKVVRRCDFENDRPYEREYSGIQKFQPISRLHASQVAVLEVGRNDVEKFFFYSMELADSQDAPGAAAGDHPLDPIRYEPRTLKSDLRLRGRLPY